MARGYLSVEGVSKHYPLLEGSGRQSQKKEFCVFQDVNLSINEGEFLSVIGHSGCGKSTLLNIIAGFERPSTGGIILDGKEVSEPGLDRMVVFQSFALMPWLNTFENVQLAVRSANPAWNKEQTREHTQKYITMMGLAGAEKKRPAFLSGGMRQRVGLARAFAVRPKVLLLDEPFAQIDALTRGVIQEELVSMWNTMKNTIFMVTHDVDEAILLSDRIALMSNGPDARLAEVLEVNIPQPRKRETMIDTEEYSRLRNHILHFLLEGSKHKKDKDDNVKTNGAKPPFATSSVGPSSAAKVVMGDIEKNNQSKRRVKT